MKTDFRKTPEIDEILEIKRLTAICMGRTCKRGKGQKSDAREPSSPHPQHLHLQP